MEKLEKVLSPKKNKADEISIIVENKSAIEKKIFELIELLGEDPHREGLLKTPHRVSKMFSELLKGYSQNISSVINGALYEAEGNQEIIFIGSIPYNSLCEHHMLPFSGLVHVAYIPDKKIIGLSKIPRIVDVFCRRLQVQERLTHDLIEIFDEILNPKGVAIIVTGIHSCASIRGVKKQGINMKTMEFSGSFKDNIEIKNEFYQLVNLE